MIAEYSHSLQRKLGTEEIEAIMGQAPDYTLAIFLHFDATGKRLFGEDYGYNYARTQTPTIGSSVARVGFFDAVSGPGVDGWPRGRGHGRVVAVPLVVPK